MSIAATASPSLDHHSSNGSELGARFHALARRVQAALGQHVAGSHVVGITSCTHGEGVSTIAANLGACGAEVYEGRALLVDANLKNATQAQGLGIAESPGWSEVLAGQARVQDCLHLTHDPGLTVLPAGLERHCRLSGQRATDMLEHLRSEFKLIVVDLPPCSEIDAALLASQLVDGFLLVVEAEHVRRQAARRMQQDLERADARVLGAILNKRKLHIPGWLYKRL